MANFVNEFAWFYKRRGARTVGSAPWSPADAGVAGTVTFDPASGGFVERTSPTTPVSDTSALGTWNLSVVGGSPIALAAPADGQRPTWHANGGKPYVLSDGIDDFLTGAGVGGTTDGNITIGLRVRPGVTTANKQLLDLSTAYLVFATNSNTGFYGWVDSVAWAEGAVATTTDDQTVIFDTAAGTIERDGTVVASGLPFATNAAGEALDVISLFNNHAQEPGRFCATRLYYAAVFPGTLSAGDLVSLKNFLDGKS